MQSRIDLYPFRSISISRFPIYGHFEIRPSKSKLKVTISSGNSSLFSAPNFLANTILTTRIETEHKSESFGNAFKYVVWKISYKVK